MSDPSSEPIKLPFSVKKAIRDREVDKIETINKLSKLVGHPVMFEFDLPVVYTKLASFPHKQIDIVNLSLRSPMALLVALNTLINSIRPEGGVDVSIRDELNALWHTHIYRLTVVDEEEWKKRTMEYTCLNVDAMISRNWSLIEQGKATIGDYTNYTSLRAGVLETVVNPVWFGYTTLESCIGSIALTGDCKMDATPGEDSTPGDSRLPLHIRFAINQRRLRVKFDNLMASMNALPGLEDAKFDLDATIRSCFNFIKNFTAKDGLFEPHKIIEYLEDLDIMLKRNWKDEMVREAILEMWTAPHTIELVYGVDVKAEKAKGMMVSNRDYCGVRLAGSVLQILVGSWIYPSDLKMLSLETIL